MQMFEHTFTVEETVTLAGDSSWAAGDTTDKKIQVTEVVFELLVDEIEVEEDDEFGIGYVEVYVTHNGGWEETYTDSGWDEGITALVTRLIGTDSGEITCTEQGGQVTGRAEMETEAGRSNSVVQWVMKHGTQRTL